MPRAVALVFALVAACGDDARLEPDAAIPREQVALVPVAPRQDLDVLLVIDDSPGGLELQTSLRPALPAFVSELMISGMPNLHIGAVTSDLGTRGAEDAQPGPSIGSGPGSCSGEGKAAALMTSGSIPITGNFLVDVSDGAGGRTTNFTGSLTTALSALTYFNASGCGFEQPIEAMKRGLDNNPANAGFLRPNATLAVVWITDEDDCSFAHSTLLGTDTSALGPLSSFRCTRFGVACDVGGITTDDMAVLGTKDGCHWREDSAYLTSRARYEAFLSTLKPDRRDILLAAIAGDSTPVEVQARTPPGGGTAIPALMHSCAFNDLIGPSVADPAVRIHDLVSRSPRSRFDTRCSANFDPATVAIAREIRGMLGDACLTREIALPANCEAFDHTPTSAHPLPPCSATTTSDCFKLVEDAACTTSHRLRLDVTRTTPPTADTMVRVMCRT